MEIKQNDSHPSNKGPADWFTGNVHIETLNQAPAPARVGISNVTLEPGARTAWHSHPLGQTLIVTAGSGLAQGWGGPIQKISNGRRSFVLARGKALAWRYSNHSHDPSLHCGMARRQVC